MKRLLILLTFFVATAQGFAQTGTYDRLWARYSLQLRDWRLDSVKRDTNFLNFTHSVPTADAVARFLESRLSGFTPGGSGAVGRKETFTGSTASAITLGVAPADTAATLVFLNGVLLHSSDYSISGATLTLGFSRLATDVVAVTYPIELVEGTGGGSVSAPANEILIGTGSGVTSNNALKYDPATNTLTHSGHNSRSVVGGSGLPGLAIVKSDGVEYNIRNWGDYLGVTLYNPDYAGDLIKFRQSGALGLTNKATDPAGNNGDKYYNSTTHRDRAYINGAWQNVTTDNMIAGLLVTGKIIYVDNLNANATDSRAGLSKYSQTAPFATIQAAVNAATPTAKENIVVRAGTYNENVSINGTTLGFSYDNTPTIILDGAVVDGGSGTAMHFDGNFDPRLFILNNAQIKNTGVEADKYNTAALRTTTARLWIYGNSTDLSKVSSVNAHAFFSQGVGTGTDVFIERVGFSSTKGYAFENLNSNANTYLSYCKFSSSENTAIYGGATVIMEACKVAGVNGVNVVNQVPQYQIRNSEIAGFGGAAIMNSELGASSTGAFGLVYNSTLTGYDYIFHFFGSSQVYKVRFDNCKFILTNPSATVALYPDEPWHYGGAGSQIKTNNIVSSTNLFTDWLRTNHADIIKESNTNYGDTTSTFGVRVGFGVPTPTAQVHIKGATGYNQLRLQTPYTPTGTSDTNGNTGDMAWDDNYIYIKTSAGWKRTALSTF